MFTVSKFTRCHAGSKLLKFVLEAAEKQFGIQQAFLHVQASNAAAIEFYSKHGFELTETLKNYYKRLQPTNDAVILRRCPGLSS